MDAAVTIAIVVGSVAVLGNIGSGVAIIRTWNRNGRDASKKYGELEATVKAGNEKAEVALMKMDNLDTKFDDFKTSTVTVIAKYGERIDGHTADISRIEGTMERRKT